MKHLNEVKLCPVSPQWPRASETAVKFGSSSGPTKNLPFVAVAPRSLPSPQGLSPRFTRTALAGVSTEIRGERSKPTVRVQVTGTGNGSSSSFL